MAEYPRLDELRRRVERDPASIAFAALAEEYRRAGRFNEAIETCRAGLRRHPVYLSARVTLARALLETGAVEEAGREVEHVLRVAPDNLAALQTLGDIQRKTTSSPGQPQPSPAAVTMEPRVADRTGTMSASGRSESSSGQAPAAEAAVLAGLEELLEAIFRARAALDLQTGSPP